MERPSGGAVPPDPTRFRLLRRLPDSTLLSGGLELSEGEGLLWLDLTAASEAELAWLGGRFGFHPLALEDCAHLDQRPKIEEYGDHLFLVQHDFSAAGEAPDLEIRELHAFLGRDYLVTVHEAPIAALDAVFARVQTDPAVSGRGPDFWLYLVTDRVTDAHFAVLDELAEAIEVLEDQILTRPNRESIGRIFALKRVLVLLRKIVSPTRDVLGVLCKRGDPRVGERTALYFRDVYDHLVRVSEAIEADRDLLGNALDAYLSMAANRTNDIVKQLTIFSVIFLPLTFITGFFGQNFTSIMPFERRWMFELMLLLCGATPLAMILWFRSKSWF
jgi:magnesium transporter